ncbi:MAG: GAF domain-containing protein [Terriglobales bacterium]
MQPGAMGSRETNPELNGNSSDPSNHNRSNLEERELEAALQLLVERAQYITGATGTALALPQGDEMVCRASAGACAPTVGARLQVRSGLTGESIARRQLLRCDNAETDPRVNLETCRALGIASIVVLPLLRRTGEVRGLFELFSDHPYAFEERDLIALERMAALTLTALDLAEQGHDSVSPPAVSAKQTRPAGPATSSGPSPIYPPREIFSQSPRPETQGNERVAPFRAEPVAAPASSKSAEEPELMRAAVVETPLPESAPAIESTTKLPAPAIPTRVIETAVPESAPVPEAMRRVQKCASCGFPVSEGRTLCLDCESLERLKIESDRKARGNAAREVHPIEATTTDAGSELKPAQTEENAKQDGMSLNEIEDDHSTESSAAPGLDEILPHFLTNPQLVEESWLARHVNLLAFLVLIAAVLVAAVVFFH